MLYFCKSAFGPKYILQRISEKCFDSLLFETCLFVMTLVETSHPEIKLQKDETQPAYKRTRFPAVAGVTVLGDGSVAEFVHHFVLD